MNIAKASILNPEESDNAAVRLALAETHIIQETKSYLESQGVNLTSFSFTPIPASQLAAGRAKGRNVMIPDGLKKGYTVVEMGQQFNAGVQDIPPVVQQGIDLMFKQ